jgi:CDP-diglyceride synthetase
MASGLIWANDSLGYFWAVVIGRSQFDQAPVGNKTIEGFIGGFISILGFAFVASFIYAYNFTYLSFRN